MSTEDVLREAFAELATTPRPIEGERVELSDRLEATDRRRRRLTVGAIVGIGLLKVGLVVWLLRRRRR